MVNWNDSRPTAHGLTDRDWRAGEDRREQAECDWRELIADMPVPEDPRMDGVDWMYYWGIWSFSDAVFMRRILRDD